MVGRAAHAAPPEDLFAYAERQGGALHDAKTSRAVGTTTHRESIESRFWRFNRQNPQVFDRLLELARRERAAGATRMSIARLFEVLRHEGIATQGDRYELNNDFRRPYAQRLEEMYPEEFGGLFEHRAPRAA